MVGAVIGNYQLVRKLGEGGMGAVYLGQHTLLGRRAAIKVLLPMLSARPDIVSRFFNEARAVTSISDAGIVQVFDFGYHTDGSAYIVMEYLEGEPLDRRLARLGRLPAMEVLRLGRQLASSLAAAHAQGITHRDLKPENIFLVHDAEVVSGERTKILDFGIAKLSDDHPGKLKTSTGMLMGTPVYMSPEQCRGLPEIDHRSDIYSLGCVLFHLVTGRPPFEGEGPGDIISAHIREPAPAPSSRAPDILAGMDALVLRCLAKAPGDRFQTMAEVTAAVGQQLHLFSSGAPVNPAPVHHMLPTTRVPITGPPAPPGVFEASVGAHPTPAPVGPTTLGASAGQFTTAPPRQRRIGLWIATALVVGAAGIGIAIIGTHGSGGATGTAGTAGTGSSAMAAQPAEPAVAGSSSATAAGGTAPVVADAGTVAVEPARVAPDAAEQVAVNAPVNAQENAIDAGAAESPVKAAAAPAPPLKPSIAAPARDTTRKSKHPKRPVPAAVAPQDARPRSESGSAEAAAATPPAAPATPPAAPAKAASSPAKPAPAKCAKTAFAAIYNAAAPSREQLEGALGTLRECHTSGAINDADFTQTRDALVAKLMAKS